MKLLELCNAMLSGDIGNMKACWKGFCVTMLFFVNQFKSTIDTTRTTVTKYL